MFRNFTFILCSLQIGELYLVLLNLELLCIMDDNQDVGEAQPRVFYLYGLPLDSDDLSLDDLRIEAQATIGSSH